MICQDCGIEAPTKYVAFYGNIGALVMRFPSSVEGRLCKSCIHKHFWKKTGTTFFLGWWGTISFFVTPFFLLNNIGRYIFCLGMPGAGPDAVQPTLSDAEVDRINRYSQELFERLGENEDFERVVTTVADRAGVTPGQVALFVHLVIQSHQEQSQT